jgi:hypothetical protein
MPGASTEVWEDIDLGPKSEVVLEDTYTPPLATCDGLDQTHLVVQHGNNGRPLAAAIYCNPEAGVFCPPPPGP